MYKILLYMYYGIKYSESSKRILCRKYGSREDTIIIRKVKSLFST